MPEEINHSRRRFLRNAAITIAASKLALIGSADAQTEPPKSTAIPPD